MKSIITLSLLLICAAGLSGQKTQIAVTRLSDEVIELTIQFGALQKTPVNTPQGTAYVINVDQGTPWLEAGAPDLPKVAIPLMLPPTGAVSVNVDEVQFTEETGMLVAPSKGNLKRNIDPATVPYVFGDVYQQNNYYPQQQATLQAPFIFRNARGTSLWVTPAQYVPDIKRFRTIQQMRVTVHIGQGAGENELTAENTKPASRTFSDLYKKLFINHNQNWVLGERSALQPEKMLVIANDNLIDDLMPLVAWKRQMGIHTTVVPYSEVGSSLPADLFNYVKNYYNENGITYLLLVGDEAAIVPMVRPGSPYSCDNCLGFMEGNDHFPEILVGRYNAVTPEDVRIMVRRNLDYEKTPLVDSTANWCATAVGLASNEGQGIGDDNQADYEHQNDLKNKHLQDGYEKIWEFYDGSHASISPTPGDETADKTGNPTNVPIVEVLNARGAGLFNYTGHGWEQGLSSGNFDVGAAGNMRNTHRYPILIAVACCAGNFTNGLCLGEALQRAGNESTGESWGTIGAFLSSDFQSWAPPMEGQDGMNQYLMDADGIALRPVTSAMGAYGNALMIAAYGTGGEEMADVWNPFFEPTFVPRTRLPQVLTVNHNAEIFTGTTSLAVQCGAEGAQVALYAQEQTLAVATVENGTATFEFPELTEPTTLMITGTQFNYTPYQAEIKVVPSAGPYLLSQAITANDAAGNNNGVPEFKENITLDLTLQNVGVETATGAEAVLSTNDPYITITDDVELFGDIDQAANLQINGAFAYQIADGVPNGHKAQFQLQVTYSTDKMLIYDFEQTISAPELEVTQIKIKEGPGSDLDDRIESGETIQIDVVHRNKGNSDIGNLTVSLGNSSTWLSSINDQISPDLGTGDQHTESFLLQVPADAPINALVSFDYTLHAGLYSAGKQSAPIRINPIIENFESVSFNEFPWTMTGNKSWVITNFQPYSGSYCARSGQITHNQKSEMLLVMDVLEEGEVSFGWKTATESNDYLRFYIDDVKIAEWSGTNDWAEAVFPLTTGQHLLKWSYEKNASLSGAPDRVYVDEILLPLHELIIVGVSDGPDNQAFESQVTPNPATETVWLSIQVAEQMQLGYTLSDLNGRVVISQAPQIFNAGLQQIPVDIRALPAGVYSLSLQGNNGVRTHKVVKQ